MSHSNRAALAVQVAVKNNTIGSLPDDYRKLAGFIKIQTTEIIAKDLKPGDLFSTAGPEYWLHFNETRSIGEKIYIRTNQTSDNVVDCDQIVYKIEVLK